MRKTLVAFIVFVLAVAGYAVYWHRVAAQLRAGLDSWAEARRAEGYGVRWTNAAVDGFPTAFRLRLDGVALAARQPTAYEITSPALRLDAAPWNLRRWRVEAPQGAVLAAAGNLAAFAAAGADGTVALGTADGTVADLTARDIAGREAAAGLHAASVEARLALPAAAPASHRDTAFALALRIAELALPHAVPPFGATVETVSVATSWKGKLPGGPLPQALAAWRDDGGTIELLEGRLRWGALDFDMSGTLSLDAELQPEGALTARFKNQNAVVDAAVAAGGMRDKDAGLAKAFLGLMAQPGRDGEKQITLPVTVQDRQVFLGPAKLGALPRIDWR